MALEAEVEEAFLSGFHHSVLRKAGSDRAQIFTELSKLALDEDFDIENKAVRIFDSFVKNKIPSDIASEELSEISLDTDRSAVSYIRAAIELQDLYNSDPTDFQRKQILDKILLTHAVPNSHTPLGSALEMYCLVCLNQAKNAQKQSATMHEDSKVRQKVEIWTNLLLNHGRKAALLASDCKSFYESISKATGVSVENLNDCFVGRIMEGDFDEAMEQVTVASKDPLLLANKIVLFSWMVRTELIYLKWYF
eukprot:GHVP01054193.1.p1 GENE.GHVP01054193.1~~GHVP01054193.1.p1  ORF type:complete len:261 (+),score=59.47 GHVP01054193.1:32-784(+)